MPLAQSVDEVELLAPAGDRDCLQAAVENGADAVYFGLDHGFNARARAANMPLAELPEIMEFLHSRGVRGYVAVNILVFSDELNLADRTIREIAAAGADAVLVQDIGLARLIRQLAPTLPIHASTQMTLTSAECLDVAADLGIERSVMARELSVEELQQIARESTLPLEAFVHGALCVAYSGQCLTSESLGGRSANRGQCAQACRLPYELVCDGRDVELGDVKYLLSPQDLAAYELIPRMLEAGVRSFKIEGRLKTPEYVANVTRHYRQAIDAALAGRSVEKSRLDVEEMELSFSRGFSPGWLMGCDHKMLVPGLSSAKRGVLLGEVTAVEHGRVRVRLRTGVSAGDGVVFEGDRAAGTEKGGRVFTVHPARGKRPDPAGVDEVWLSMDRRSFEHSQLTVGQLVWKTDDPQLTARLRRTFAGPDPQRRTPIDLRVKAAVGEPLELLAESATGASACVVSNEPLAEAQRHPLSAETLRDQFGRLGGTIWELREVRAEISGTPMAPFSVLGRMRREMVEQLEESNRVRSRRSHSVSAATTLDELRRSAKQTAELAGRSLAVHASPNETARMERPAGEPAPKLIVLCRSLAQLRGLLTGDALIGHIDEVVADFADIREYRQAVEAARATCRPIWLATPRIQKPGESGVFRAMEKHAPDGILVRNLAGLRHFANIGLATIADFSLNAANELTTAWLLEQGASRVAPSYDLNREQLLGLVDATGGSPLEVVVHQHMPMFHMEHCVFCAVLSPGTNKTNCGRPCDHHLVQLRDRIGMEHPLTADVGCRNTLFNAVPQSSAEIVPALLDRGVQRFRVELLWDEPAAAARTIRLYRDLLAGRVRGKDVWRELNATNRIGVTRGTLDERRNPLAIL